MDDYLPANPTSFSLPSVPANTTPPKAPHRDWPHAPVHRMSVNGVYIVTAGTLHKQRLFNTPAKLDLLEGLVLTLSKQHKWQLEAWAIMSNHYHFVARGAPDSTPMGDFLLVLHSRSGMALNQLDAVSERRVWYNFWDTRLTHQYAYLARLNYVHQNPVRHKVVSVANQYRWGSARWFERVASPAQIKTIYSFKTDRVKVADDF
jgi:putative transposase